MSEYFESTAGENKGVFARFYDKLIKTDEILENGLPKFKYVLYVQIRLKDQYDVFDQPASYEHTLRFKKEYETYLAEKKEVKKGTPLAQFSFLNAEQIEMCRFWKIFTVEALSELNEEKARELDLTQEKKLACRFLDLAKNNGKIFEEQKQREADKLKIKALEEEITRLKQLLKQTGGKK